MIKKAILLIVLIISLIISVNLAVRSIYTSNIEEPSVESSANPSAITEVKKDPQSSKPVNSNNTDDTEVAQHIPVLMYHHLLKNDENIFKNNSSILSVESFQEHMELLYKEGYTTLTLKQLENFLLKKEQFPKKSVVITFDDGYKSNYKYAYPILKQYGFVASIFMITDKISETTVPFDANQLQYLSWEEMELSKDVFEFVGHSHNLHHLDNNGKSYLISKPKEEITEDLRKNLEIIHNPYFAYPYGHYNSETIEILQNLGYKMAFTINEGSVKPGDHLFELKRHSIFPYTTIQNFLEKLK